MTNDDVVELVSEMKRLGVLYFEHNGLKVAFRDSQSSVPTSRFFSDQEKILEELSGVDLMDEEGEPATTGYNDEDLFGSS